MAEKYALQSEIPNKLSQLENDSKFLADSGGWQGPIPGEKVWSHTTPGGGEFVLTEEVPEGGGSATANIGVDGKFYCREGELEVLAENSGVIAPIWGRYKQVDLSSLDQNKWYPCAIGLGYPSLQNRPIEFYLQNALDGLSHPSWAQHDAGFTLQVGIRVNPSGWGGCPEDPVYLFYNYRFGGESAFGGFKQDGTNSTLIVWLRGGAIYFYYCTNNERALTIYENGYTSPNDSQFNCDVETSQGGLFRSTSTILSSGLYNSHFRWVHDGEDTHSGLGDYSNGDLTLVSGRNGMDMRFYTNNANIDFHVQNYVEGNVNSNRIAWFNASDNGFYSNYSIHAEGGFFKDSDERLKTNIREIDCTLEDILSIPTVEFTMHDKDQIGTIAQKLEPKFKSLVKECTTEANRVTNPEEFEHIDINGEDYVKVKKTEYELLSILAIKGLKLLNEKINELERKLKN